MTPLSPVPAPVLEPACLHGLEYFHQGRTACTIDLSIGTFHRLTLIGDCAVTFTGGLVDYHYQLSLRQDIPGGHHPSFPNLFTPNAEPVAVGQDWFGHTVLSIYCDVDGNYHLTGLVIFP